MIKKLISMVFIFMLVATPAFSSPFLVSDQATDLASGAVYQVEIDGTVLPQAYAVVDNAVKLDVQDYVGTLTIRVRFGNPWPDLADTYKWSEWSDPFTYDFPVKPGKPTGCSVAK